MEKLYIVVPCYNEQECLIDSANQLKNVMASLIEKKKIASNSKIVFINDGSKDKTWEIIKNINKTEKLSDILYKVLRWYRRKGFRIRSKEDKNEHY